jgi:hypothetical protein
LGASTERNRGELNFVRGEGFSNPNFHDAGSATTVTEYDASRSRSSLLSYFARGNFNWDDRYLATVSLLPPKVFIAVLDLSAGFRPPGDK